jgi:preprotein translocase subunit SecG
MKGSEIMLVIEYVLLVLLLVSAAFIVVAVILQQSNEDGLSGTIAGGSETFYGKDKSSNTDRALYRWTLIAAIVFAVAVLAVFIIQPDYAASYSLEDWQHSNINNYSDLFTK